MSPFSSEEREQLADLECSHLLFFRPAVLAQYRAEPHRYELKASDFDGKVGLTEDYWHELHKRGEKNEGLSVRFGYRRLRSGEYGIVALVHDFREYSQGHAARWRPFQIPLEDLAPLPDVRFENWAARILFGSWDVENNLIQRIADSVVLINAATAESLGSPLFANVESPHVAAPVSENDHAYQDAHGELYAYLLDGLRKEVVLELLTRTGASKPKGENGTRKLLQAALPSMAPSPLWTALARVSDERAKAAHNVRPRATAFGAFEVFASDLEEIETGMRDLLVELQSVLGIDAEKAKKRHEARRVVASYRQAMQNPFGAVAFNSIVGRTVERVEYGLREASEDAHGSDVVRIHFTDGSVIGFETHSNACNVSSAYGGFPPSEFNTNFFAQFVPPPQT